MGYNTDGMMMRVQRIRKIALEHYEPGRRDRSYKAVWEKHVRAEYGICYRTFLRYMEIAPGRATGIRAAAERGNGEGAAGGSRNGEGAAAKRAAPVREEKPDGRNAGAPVGKSCAIRGSRTFHESGADSGGGAGEAKGRPAVSGAFYGGRTASSCVFPGQRSRKTGPTVHVKNKIRIFGTLIRKLSFTKGKQVAGR